MGQDRKKLGFPKEKQGFRRFSRGPQIGQESEKLVFPKEKQGFL